MGGHTENPTYEDVKSGNTGHYETVKIEYDVALFHIINYWKYFSVIDPLDEDGQFQDRGSQYQTAIFTLMKIKRNLPNHISKHFKIL